MTKIFVTIILFIASFPAVAGPFGLSKGMTLEEAKKYGDFVSGNSPFVYTAKTLAGGHPDFESYSIILTPQQGLCKIQASGKDVNTSAFGDELKAKHIEFVKALSNKYGSPGNNYDFLRLGSIWKDPQDWMMALLKKERTLASYWSSPERTNLPDSLLSIELVTAALSGSKGYLRLSYEFNNLDACLLVLNAKKDANL